MVIVGYGRNYLLNFTTSILTMILGMAIRAAQSIGLHCVPPLSEYSTAVERKSWELWYETNLADHIDLVFPY